VAEARVGVPAHVHSLGAWAFGTCALHAPNSSAPVRHGRHRAAREAQGLRDEHPVADPRVKTTDRGPHALLPMSTGLLMLGLRKRVSAHLSRGILDWPQLEIRVEPIADQLLVVLDRQGQVLVGGGPLRVAQLRLPRVVDPDRSYLWRHRRLLPRRHNDGRRQVALVLRNGQDRGP